MKVIFILYLSINGPVYDYYEMLSFYDQTICEDAAEALNQENDTRHAYCAKDFYITQPDGSVRPELRP